MILHPNTKINLGLNVLRKRPDGYHDIETLFVPYFGLRDVLEIVAGDDYSRTSAALFGKYGFEGGCGIDEHFCKGGFRNLDIGSGENDDLGDGSSGGSGEEISPIRQWISPDGKVMITIARAEGVDWGSSNDLCVKAYRLLDEDFNLPPVKIFLEKLIPVGAGLGGGSADAAFTLRALSEMFSLGLDSAALMRYASQLGSDCAFFILNSPAFGQGRGEILTPFPLPVLDEYDLQVIVPEGVSISTAQAYSTVVPAAPPVPLKEILSRPAEQWNGLLLNDFEPGIFANYPELTAIRQSLYDTGAIYASLSGTGSAIFALYRK